LTGSERRAGQRVRIAVQLIDTANNLYLWSDAYDPELDDLLQLQDGISMAIVSTLRIRLADRLRLAVPQAAPRNFEVTIFT
jgi:adenylate cyclase